jgi:hypothetical protein
MITLRIFVITLMTLVSSVPGLPLFFHQSAPSKAKVTGCQAIKEREDRCQIMSLDTPVAHFSNSLILHQEAFRHYIDSFNAEDRELYRQYIPNDSSWAFLSRNIPLFNCPDKQLEQTYYFRWWTYRKHIRKTPEGFVILEFLPDVDWAKKYNTINCAAALHVYEGRWLHEQQFLDDYSTFWYKGGGDRSGYSWWMSDAIWNRALVTGNFDLPESLEEYLVEAYQQWEKDRQDSTGLYWQVDDGDGMEESICGKEGQNHEGYRATINSYMYADAEAISKIAGLKGQNEVRDLFQSKAALIKEHLLKDLWDPSAGFFKVIPRGNAAGPGQTPRRLPFCGTRELHGYTPWLFSIPPEDYASAWRFLMDPHFFYAPYGPTTAEQGAPGFQISYKGHECQWNGPSWPFATSVTLTALANQLHSEAQPYVTREDYFKLLKIYARSQQRKLKDGKVVPWIDENLNPFTGDWIARSRLSTWENGHWSAEKGGEERGKDYNHSTFCDLIITGLAGLRPEAGDHFVVDPLLPAGRWEYFCLDNVLYHGHLLTILYDRTGQHYHHGKGLAVYIDGKKAAFSPNLSKLDVNL